MSKTYWLSFADADRRKGKQFLGVAIVEVTDEEAARAAILVAKRWPHANPGAEWLAAATTKARALGCNPGGEVAFMPLGESFPGPEVVPRGTLLSRAELERLGLLDPGPAVSARPRGRKPKEKAL